jgi:hypothetical protein
MKVYFPKAKMADIVVQDLGDEALIFDIITNRAYCLNSTSRAIFMASDGATSIDMIAERLSLNTGKRVEKELVAYGVEELSKQGLLSTDPGTGHSLVSRRDAITKIGLASAIALPIVASIVAPAAINAQSCLANDQSCTASSQCCSGCCKNVGGGINQCKPGGGACLP